MTAPATGQPTAGDFLADAAARLDRLTTTLTPWRNEDVDTVAAVRELSRIVAQLTAAVRVLAESEASR